MDLGRKLRTIEEDRNIHVREFILAAVLFAATGRTFFENWMDQRFLGIRLVLMIRILAAILALVSVLKYKNFKPGWKIEVYEGGLVLGDFRSSLEGLEIKARPGRLVVSNGQEEVELRARLAKKDLEYLKGL